MMLRPCTVKAAIKWVKLIHRRLPNIQGGMWAIAVHEEGEMVGCAIVGHAARLLADKGVLSVLRVAVLPEHKNACSMLYGACARAAKAMGARGLVTYTHQDEPGTSLKAAGWICDGLTGGGEWSRPSRVRERAVSPERKYRWWAPWSVGIKDKDELASPI